MGKKRGSQSAKMPFTLILRLVDGFVFESLDQQISKRAAQRLNSLWDLPVYPVFEDKYFKCQTKNRSAEK